MDLVGYAEERFDAVAREVLDWSSRLGLHGVGFIPVSALHGDNVVDRSAAMTWYGGQSLLEHLESVPAGNGHADGPARLPVQYVIRADGTRWYAGRLASGTLEIGDELIVLPAGTRTRVRAFEGGGDRAVAPRSIAVSLADELDVGRGDLLARPAEAPEPVRELTATVCWLGDEPARPGARYLIKHTTRSVPAKLDAIEHRLDVTTLGRRARRRARAQRDRPRPPAPRRAAGPRPLRAGPRHRCVHRGRRSDERHGRRRHGRAERRRGDRPAAP